MQNRRKIPGFMHPRPLIAQTDNRGRVEGAWRRYRVHEMTRYRFFPCNLDDVSYLGFTSER
eukprot:scaffold670_cov333-Pavlova_lutheri.AAC.33